MSRRYEDDIDTSPKAWNERFPNGGDRIQAERTYGEARGYPGGGLRRPRQRAAGALAPYCDMPWRLSLEHIEANEPVGHLDIPGFSPGNAAYEARFPSGHGATRGIPTPSYR